MNVSFPLTPALSLREREREPTRRNIRKRSAFYQRMNAFPLSPGERAGVRGNAACCLGRLLKSDFHSEPPYVGCYENDSQNLPVHSAVAYLSRASDAIAACGTAS